MAVVEFSQLSYGLFSFSRGARPRHLDHHLTGTARRHRNCPPLYLPQELLCTQTAA
jgi:hypothetical protein